LREAFDLAARQSEQEQATIAARLKEMIEADRQWDALLSGPDSLSMLEEMAEEMAEEAHQDYLHGETESIEPEPK
jgi:hypothetical protein